MSKSTVRRICTVSGVLPALWRPPLPVPSLHSQSTDTDGPPLVRLLCVLFYLELNGCCLTYPRNDFTNNKKCHP